MKMRKGKRGWVAVKIDFEKTYDILEWDFICSTIRKHKLDSNTCNLIMSCITSVSSSFIFNGHPSENFQPSRGIRQGDLFSPYIFILCMEHMTYLINASCQEDSWTPLSILRNNLSVSHLLFDNDILLFNWGSNCYNC